MKKIIVTLFLAGLIFTPLANANQTDKYRVSVIHDGSDPVGGMVLFYVRETIRNTPHFELVEDFEDSPGLALVIATKAIDSDHTKSTISVTYVFHTDLEWEAFGARYAHAEIGHCDSSRVESCASDYVFLLDQVVGSLKEVYDEEFLERFFVRND